MANGFHCMIMNRVDRGARYLDAGLNGWHKHINLRELRMESEWGCILGQLFGSYWSALDELLMSAEQSAEHGFHLLYQDWGRPTKEGYEGFIVLKRCWIDEIAYRLTKDQLR